MTHFVFAYRMPTSYEPGGPGAAQAWGAWFESLGGALVDIGNPAFEATALGSCGEGTKLGGYSIIAADDLESAVALAKGCPAIAGGAGVEVGMLTAIYPRA